MQGKPYRLLMEELHQLLGTKLDGRVEKNESVAIVRNTRKLLTMYRCWHPRADVDRLEEEKWWKRVDKCCRVCLD